ncbi:MAG: LacI family DNA-binding transcriptional regulator [Wenzhouxiangellaceae bacterium]|nr:LacI family DNA-binding transcriptional regulator [Wenzhouxiangellaceae bacterium]
MSKASASGPNGTRKHRPAKGHVTISDVADLAGVSIKTVSRVINHEPNVRPATAERVHKAIQTLDYLPDPSARGLAGQQSWMIGLIYENPSPNYLFRSILGALQACNKGGYALSMHSPEPNEDDLARMVERFVSQSRVDGLLLTPPVGDVPAVLDALERIGLPCVRVAPLDGRPGLGVCIDDRSAAARVVDHLIELGHRRIGFVKGHPDHGASDARQDGYRLSLMHHGLPIDESLEAQGQFDFESGHQAGIQLLELKSPPTAIFAANDEMAAGVMQAAQQLGWRIPDDLSVAGFDDTPLSRSLWPPLTTVHQPIRHMALRATELLIEQIARRNRDEPQPEGPSLQLFDAPLVVRATTAPPPAR